MIVKRELNTDYHLSLDDSVIASSSSVLDLIDLDVRAKVEKWLQVEKQIQGLLISISKMAQLSQFERENYDLIINFEESNKFCDFNQVMFRLNNLLKNGGILVLKVSYNNFFNLSPDTCEDLAVSDQPNLGNVILSSMSKVFSKKSVFNQVEILGRIFGSGFEFLDEISGNNNAYLICRKTYKTNPLRNADRGPLIRLTRIGEGGSFIKIYKFRTMYPYAEYLQEYIFEKNKLKSSGKINDDYRVTPWGYFLRKYWIDELPMLWNWLRGDLKFVGVRPVSFHYFSLYPSKLKELRMESKPGLFPPYYADSPKNFEEIVASEIRYLQRYSESPIKTDVIYFLKIVINILIKRPFSS